MADDDLQFERTDRVETAAVALCGYCNQPLDGTYYQINGRAACQRCHAQLQASLEKHGPVVSFVVATVFGTVAAALGGLVWYAVRAMTGYEIGLIAVAVGFGVGFAVNKGSTGPLERLPRAARRAHRRRPGGRVRDRLRALPGRPVPGGHPEHHRHPHHRFRAVRGVEAQQASAARDQRPVPGRGSGRDASALKSLCPECGSDIAPGLRECPGCHRLVYADELRALAAEAEAAHARNDLQAESAAWRQALQLLPHDSRQHAAITEKVVALSRVVDAQGAGAPPAGSRWARWLAPLGAFGLFLWKIKFVVALVLTKGKLLLLGLLKAPTLFSALASFGVYWTVWGWPFALGVVVSIYIHEMGHVFALSRYGIRASAPMFVPGIGAFVRGESYPADPREDARGPTRARTRAWASPVRCGAWGRRSRPRRWHSRPARRCWAPSRGSRPG
jgi:hypothetical protein